MATYLKLTGNKSVVYVNNDEAGKANLKYYHKYYPADYKGKRAKQTYFLPSGKTVNKRYFYDKTYDDEGNEVKEAKPKKVETAIPFQRPDTPIQGDWVQLLNANGEPCEDFSFVETLVEAKGSDQYIITDMYGKQMWVKANPERDHPPRKAFVQMDIVCGD